MKTKTLLAAACAAFCSAAIAAKIDADWCTVEFPEQWNFREETKGFDVTVTLKKGAPTEGNWLQPHLLWMRKAGFGGFQAWQNPRKKLEVGKPYTFHYNPKVNEDEVDRYAFRCFLAPNGDDKKIVKEQYAEIKIPPPPPYPEMPADCRFKKSYIKIDEQPRPVRVGEDVVLKVHYYLDPSETWGPKQSILSVTPLGPWIDNPDGVINKRRHHVSYGGGMFTKDQRVEAGEHTAEFRFKLGQAFRYNACFFLCKFKTPEGKDWPWDYRGGSLAVAPEIEVFRMYPTARGGMFYYDETPSVALVWGPTAHGKTVDAKAVVKDALNRVVCERTFRLNPSRRVQSLFFPEIKARGIFSLTVKAPGYGKDGAEFEDFCYFGRIPRFERIEGRATPFGVTNVGSLDLSSLAYDMGFSTVRHFTSWSGIEPMKGKWSLGGLDSAVENNHKAGLKAWIQLHGPPSWTLPPEMGRTGEFEPAPFRLEDWSDTIDFLAKRYKGKLYGFEFLNEIVPGKACKDPVKEYVEICRAGYEAAKRNDPNLVCQLAGGLWPHTFRVDCLNAGIAKYIDVLPIHYGNYEGIREAQKDLAVRGIRNVRVADNETATGYSIWNYPPDMAFEKSLAQCRYVMSRWPDELCAGADFICYFGGNGDACGNWSYMIDLTSPRPVAATLAVVQGKLAYAKPIGKFFVGETVCHLFERDGKPCL
ncbi:MAG: cellulase family glycosylhydrolase, partial [Kiritimatiellae bacterium]|nr:cellulase family glycosylhydrolase [Kiritimatiellia bacterium]